MEYHQGMNVIAGVFLFVLPELLAYNCFKTFMQSSIPTYWKSNHIGTLHFAIVSMKLCRIHQVHGCVYLS
jgi:hypothetical protein